MEDSDIDMGNSGQEKQRRSRAFDSDFACLRVDHIHTSVEKRPRSSRSTKDVSLLYSHLSSDKIKSATRGYSDGGEATRLLAHPQSSSKSGTRLLQRRRRDKRHHRFVATATTFLVLCTLNLSSFPVHGFSPLSPPWGRSTERVLVNQRPGHTQPQICTDERARSPFSLAPRQQGPSRRHRRGTHGAPPLFLYAPPGSGYAGREDEVSALPTTYEPMMEYPGTMRPGRTPENMPFHDLPIGDDDPDPVPWPHLQQISWHHQWEPPHEHPIPIEDFIELQNRWASPEREAEMRAGARQSVRERRELQESEKRQMVITDDDDDDLDADDAVEELNVALGEGVFGRLGSDADRAATAIATSPREGGGDLTDVDLIGGVGVGDSENLDDDGLDFLLDLGLDMLDDDDDGGVGVPSDRERISPGSVASLSRSGVSTLTPPAKVGDGDDDDIDFDDEDVPPSSAISVEVDDDDDDVIDFGSEDDDVVGVDEDDMDDDAGGSGSGLDEVSLDDYGDNDGLEADIFDEGGFDYDDYENDNDGGDMW